MILFLTSSPGGYAPSDEEHMGSAFSISEKNGLLDRLRDAWPDRPAQVVAISADPDNQEMNDMMTGLYNQMFSGSELPVKEMNVVDGDHAQDLDKWLADCDVLMLNGGHVPTQNRFMKKLGLREKLEGYDGIVIGISAGTMNAADCVYAQPELPGEAIDPNYERFLTGLNLTKISILPHYEANKNDMLDGMRLYEDITYPDSFGHVFYAMEDGGYLYNDGTQEMLLGNIYEIKDGAIRQVCEDGETLTL